MESRSLVAKIFLGLTGMFVVGYSLAMSLSFAGGWVAPAAPLIERVGLLSFLGAIVSVVGYVISNRTDSA